ncbi:MAG: PIG-L family deacetylase [Burkholderiales bacterium]|nr:PIG-L family deacetylase [Anaerolineae bacterium]
MQIDQSKTPERILVIAAHADDIEFGAAGSVARWVSEGAEVAYCIVTDGGAGSNDPNTVLADLITLRRKEQDAAAACVGVKQVFYLNYADGVLMPSLELRKDITRVIRQFKPQRVLCFDPTTMFAPEYGYINHPDHRASAEASLYAVFPSAQTRPIFPDLLAEGLEPHKVNELYLMFSMQSNVAVDITEFMEHKIDALSCHKSQISEDSFKWIREGDQKAGEQVGCAYAETFLMMQLERDPAAEDAAPSPSETEAIPS